MTDEQGPKIEYGPPEFVKVEGMRIKRSVIIGWLAPHGSPVHVVIEGVDEDLEFSDLTLEEMDKIMGVE